MLYSYSVTPIATDHFEERVRDIVDMHKRGIIHMPLFSMTLVPEGDPVWDKAGKMCENYARYREALALEGVPSGILVQASLGHGHPIAPNPFQSYVQLKDGVETLTTCCPEDENFLLHFEDVLKKLAAERPRAIMLDDDFRLMMRPGKGCACAYHMTQFNRLAGTDMTREELYAHLISHPKTDRLARVFQQTQRDSLIKAAKRFRAAIDEIDPTIQGINCTSGSICESVQYTNQYFKGEGNPTMVRVPNGIYSPIGVRGFSDVMSRAAVCASKLRKNGIDIILSETDTIPFNRYAKSARYLHAHYAVSMLDGLKGAKHWLTRTSSFEPNSGKAYRDILAKHRGMYEKLAEISDEIRFVGCNSAFIEELDVNFAAESVVRGHSHFWVTDIIERLGIPFYFSDGEEAANFLEGDIVDDMTDDQIKTVLRGSVFCDVESASALIRRGYGDYLGVDLQEWDLGRKSGESFCDDGSLFATAQKDLKKITITREGVEALSHNVYKCDGVQKKLAPAVTKLKRADGKISVVFCGSPHAAFNYREGFSFLNETRKAQLVGLLCEAGALPVYAVGDDELCMRAGYLADGALFIMITELGIDPLDALTLSLEKKPSAISVMTPDGNELPVEFEETGSGVYTVNVRVEPMYPVALTVR